MRLLFFSWLRYICVTIVMSMSGSFVLEVFFMIVDKMILMSSWLGFSNLTNIISKPFIYNVVIIDRINIHIGYWGKILFRDLSSSGSSPMSFNSLHMPLINDCYNIFLLNFKNISENSFSSIINKDLFLFRSDFA